MTLTAASASSRRAAFLLAYPRSKGIPVLYRPFKNVYMEIELKSCVHTYQQTNPGRVIYKWLCRVFAYRRLSRSALGRTPPPSAIFKIIVMGIKKKSNPFPIWKIWFGLYWFGAGNKTGFSRLAAALRPHCGLIHYGFFKSCFCLDISLE